MNNKDFLLIMSLSTIKGVTGKGGYKLGVKALFTEIDLRNTMIREIREKEKKIDCSELLLPFVMSPCSFYS